MIGLTEQIIYILASWPLRGPAPTRGDIEDRLSVRRGTAVPERIRDARKKPYRRAIICERSREWDAAKGREVTRYRYKMDVLDRVNVRSSEGFRKWKAARA